MAYVTNRSDDNDRCDELLSIGSFARLSGLSIGALRHYDDVGLLLRARVHLKTGYRSYASQQLPQARAIQRLRELDLSLDEIRDVLTDGDVAGLRRHADRISARITSAFYWLHAEGAGPENRARSEWQISRVYAVLGRGEPAVHHAQRCLDQCLDSGIGDWDLAFAYEALARAHRVARNETSTGAISSSRAKRVPRSTRRTIGS